MGVGCRVCGHDNPDGAQFCANPSCQAYLAWESDPPASTPAGGPPPSGPPPTEGGQRMGVRAALAEPVVSVSPGTTASTTLSVYNTGTQVEGFVTSVSGPAANWTAVEPPEVSVFPEQTATLTLRLAPPRSPSCPAGPAWYIVRLDSTVHPGLSVTAHGVGDVAAFHDVAAELTPVSSSGRGATTHQVAIDNRGNVVERATLAAADDEAAFRMEFPNKVVDLPPGRLNVPLRVRPPRRWFGRPRAVPIHATVAVAGASAAIRVDGTRHVLPVFPRWLTIAALATALLAGAGAVLALRGHGRPNDDGTSTTPPVTVSPTTARQLSFLERMAGDWNVRSWTEAGGPMTLGVVVERGTMKVTADGTADWRLDIDQQGENNTPQPAITCGGRATLNETIEAQPGGGRNSSINWTKDLTSIDHSSTGEGWVWRAMCGWTTVGGRYPFTVRLEGEPSKAATLMEMSNQWGAFVWRR